MVLTENRLSGSLEKLKLLVLEGEFFQLAILSNFPYLFDAWSVNENVMRSLCRRAAGTGTGFVGGAGETELQLQRRRLIGIVLRL